MPLKEYQCSDCGFIQEALVRYPGEEPQTCPHCECDRLHYLPSVIGGYNGNLGSASTRPKGAGSRPKGAK